MAKKKKELTQTRKIEVRNLTANDYEAVKNMQLDAFPAMKPWAEDQWKKVTKTFPEGQIGIDVDGVLAASSCSLILNFDEFSKSHSWSEITGEGTLSTHKENGDTLYGIEIMVATNFRNMRLSRRLYDERKLLVQALNLKRIVVGGRLPNYHSYASKMEVKEYVQQIIDKKISDPVLTTQLSNDFKLKRIIKDYLPGDADSCGFATFMEWVNLDYQPDDFKITDISPYVRVCSIQYKMRMVKNFEEFASHCEFFIDVAADYKSDFVTFPEMFTCQLMSFLPKNRPGTAVRALTQFTEQYIQFFSSMAIKYNTNIIAGSHLTVEEDDNLYNISWLFRRDGTYGKQYKMHITPHERKWWGVKEGKKVEVFDTDCGKIAINICYDIEFPEIARIATSKGAEIIFVPFNTDERRAYNRVRYCAQARAIENQVYVVLSGCVGNLPEVENLDIQYAQSAILTPSDVEFHRDGIAAIAEPGDETMIYQDLDMHLLKVNRLEGNAQTWNDRRKNLYTLIYKEDGKEFEA